MPGSAPGLFLAGLGTLTLLASAARDKPLLCVVDDAQWLDQGSMAVLTFVARRLLAERIVLVFCARAQAEPDRRLAGLPELILRGLTEADALALITAAAPDITWSVAQRLIDDSAGNPLALKEFARELTPAQRGGTPVPEVLPLSERIERHYRRQLELLPAATRMLLLLEAADGTGDADLVWRAAGWLGITAKDVSLDQLARFLSLGDKMEFRRPLVRSAVYGAASTQQLRRAHAALSRTADPVRYPDRRAWHAAAAALPPDESVARDLESSAGRARDRGGHTVEAAFLARAAELSADAPRRGARFLAAATAAVLGGEYGRAQALLDQAAPHLPDAFDRAKIQRIRGVVLSALGHTADAPAVLADAARALEPFDPGLAADTWFGALELAVQALGYSRGTGLPEVARGALASPALACPSRDDTVGMLLLRGFATRVAVGHAAAVPILRRAMAAHGGLDQIPDGIAIRTMFVSLAALELWDSTGGMRLLNALAERDRRRGALHDLRVALLALAWQHAWTGDFRTADARYAAGSQITRLIGMDPLWDLDNLEARALRGQDKQVKTSAKAIAELAETHGLGAARGRLPVVPGNARR